MHKMQKGYTKLLKRVYTNKGLKNKSGRGYTDFEENFLKLI